MQERLSVVIDGTVVPGWYRLSLKKDGYTAFRSLVFMEDWYCFGKNRAQAKARRIIKRRARMDTRQDGSWTVTLDEDDSV